jgi:hypothetical protein
MKKSLNCLFGIAALIFSAGTLCQAATARPLTAPLMILRPNLRVISSLSELYMDPGTGQMVRKLTFSVQNNGKLPAPASTTAVTLEAGDPFSPISTAIGFQTFATPLLNPGASTPIETIILQDTVYLRVDIRADHGEIVHELTETDNHRVHSAGYIP